MKKFMTVLAAICLCAFVSLAFAQTPLEDSAFAETVKTYPATVYTILVIVGVIGHYIKKRLRGETASGIVEYFSTDHPAHSGGLLVALVLTIWAAASSDLLSGASATNIITMSILAGVGLDSVVNKGKPA